jgi:uncharacterized alkaline shock family protein YloU
MKVAICARYSKVQGKVFSETVLEIDLEPKELNVKVPGFPFVEDPQDRDDRSD